MMALALVTALCLGIANFAYQGLGDQNWLTAIERTWFQTTACLVMAFGDYVAGRLSGGA